MKGIGSATKRCDRSIANTPTLRFHSEAFQYQEVSSEKVATQERCETALSYSTGAVRHMTRKESAPNIQYDPRWSRGGFWVHPHRFYLGICYCAELYRDNRLTVWTSSRTRSAGHAISAFVTNSMLLMTAGRHCTYLNYLRWSWS